MKAQQPIDYAVCGWCADLYVVRRTNRATDVPCCRKPECKRAKQLARMNAYYATDRGRERRIAAQARYFRKNPDRFTYGPRQRAAYDLRRARKRTTAETERIVAAEIFDRDAWTCGICTEPVDPALRYPHPMSVSLDHVVPLAKGGAHTMANVQCSHLHCNRIKRDLAA